MLMFSRALAPVEGAIAGWKAFAAALSAYRRLTGVLAVMPAVPENIGIASDQPQGQLIVDNLGVELAGSGKFLLKGVSFSLAPVNALASSVRPAPASQYLGRSSPNLGANAGSRPAR